MANRQLGFSLVELMIAVVILGILLAAAVPTYRNWLENTQIRTAAESVQNGLQLARAEAARGNTSVSFTLTGNDWSVDRLAIGAASGVFYTAAENVQRKSGKEGSKHAVITPSSNPVTFNGMGRTTASVTITVKNPTGGACATNTNSSGMRCLSVVVEPGGKIRMCDPALNGSGNPQGCA
jgi:type IV fimbrial biogenesis protein FimT